MTLLEIPFNIVKLGLMKLLVNIFIFFHYSLKTLLLQTYISSDLKK